ncbi:MAG: methyl-accepting chemotaxis protein [Thermodesulfovibrionales bacterium]
MVEGKAGGYRRINFGVKIIVVVLGSFIVSYLINFLFIRQQIEESAMAALLSKARAITLQAENARNYVSDMRGTHNVFDNERLLREAREKLAGAKDPDEIIRRLRSTGYYWTIPIVVGWTIGQSNAENAGHTFRVVKIQARNRYNEPDPLERSMLEKMSASGMTEYWVVDKARNALRYMRPVVLKKDCLLCHGKESDYPAGQGFDPVGLKMEGWAEGEQHGAFEIISDLKPMQNEVRKTLLKTLLLGAIIVLLAVALISFIVKGFAIVPIRNIRESLGRVADGDLTVQSDAKTEDDIGQTVHTMNKMVRSFNAMINNVLISANNVVSTVGILRTRAEKTAEGAREQSGQASQIAAAAEEMSQTITDIARNASVASETSAEAMATAEQGKELADGAVETVNRVYTSTVELAAMVEKLNGRAGEIGDIITVIKDIADQTNLLALNAAIEAARAGEQGRGFSVVADEVRKLAEKTIKATGEISEKIGAVQSESEQTMKSMQEASGEVTRSTDFIRKVGDSLNHIVESVQKVRNQITHIAAAVDEQSAASEEVARNIEKTSAISRTMEEMSSDVMHEVQSLTKTVEELRSSTSGFKTR